MKNKRSSFRLLLSDCPDCQYDQVSVVRSVGNYTIIAISVLAAILLLPLVSYKLRCSNCGKQFRSAD